MATQNFKINLLQAMATHSSILAWRILCREEPGRLQSIRSKRVGHDRVTNTLQLVLAVLYSNSLIFQIILHCRLLQDNEYKIMSIILCAIQCILVAYLFYTFQFQFSCSLVSGSLQPHGLQHTRLPCPSPAPRACSNSCPSSQ